LASLTKAVAVVRMRLITGSTPSSARVGLYSRERISPWGVIRAVTILVPPKSTARIGLPGADSAMMKVL
jgi:hypothetical protein